MKLRTKWDGCKDLPMFDAETIAMLGICVLTIVVMVGVVFCMFVQEV